jgi:tetratricopeptide (TPR) repeat protein
MKEEGRVDHILFGSYSRAGESFRIEFTLKNMNTGDLITSEKVEGEGESSFFSMIDELTLRIKRAFKFTEEIIAADLDKSIAEATTGFLEAFKFYIEGLTLALKGDYPNAIQLYEKAVSADPHFAMAYRALGNAYLWLGNVPLAEHNVSRAFELSDRVTQRERYIIQAEYYNWVEHDRKKARDIYQNLLKIYPNDLIGTIKLGAMYALMEEWEKSIELLELCIEQDIDAFHPYFYVATSYAGKGWYEKSKDMLNYYLTNKSKNSLVRNQLINTHIFLGEYQKALIELEKFYQPDSIGMLPQSEIKAAIYILQKEMDKAEKELLNLFNSSNDQEHFRGIIDLSHFYLLLGKYENTITLLNQGIQKAKELKIGFLETWLQLSLAKCMFRYGKTEEAIQICDGIEQLLKNRDDEDSLIDVIYLKGCILVNLSLVDKAQIEAKRLRDVLEDNLNQKLMRYYFDLQGRIDYKKKDFPKAKENFKKTLSLLSFEYSLSGDQGLFYDSSASACYGMGDLDRAISLYEELTNLTTGRLFFGDIYAKSFYMLGKIYEQLGDITRAIEHYEIFLELWKDADQGLAEIEEAKKNLAHLKIQY